MTNKEIAQNLYDEFKCSSIKFLDEERDMVTLLTSMAEWKDKQCPTKDVIRKVLDIAYDHQYTDKDGMHNLKFEAEEVIEHWNEY